MIKVTIGEQKTQSSGYPKIMIRKDQGLIILFTAPSNGIVLDNGFSRYSKFEFVCMQSILCFEPFCGLITLQNA